MAQAQETPRQRRDSGPLKEHVGHVREDITGLRKDVTALATDLAALAGAQWGATTRQLQAIRHGAVERANSSTRYVGEQARARPLSALGAAAGVGVILGWALSRRR
jgi:ElaB/YqjD/DUF883 family membrane-anchored ribosome-binding protein